MSKFFISCDETTTICDKNQYNEATFLDKMKLMVHFIICKHCKKYSKQNTFLSKIFGNYAEEQCREQKCMSHKDKEILEEKVKEKL
ncbi:MAG: hypothetical protein L3J14_05085 [Flavobacteriaceae bacterium]|nr:hypothetical protein [Flavobacteriaceae bacterium]